MNLEPTTANVERLRSRSAEETEAAVLHLEVARHLVAIDDLLLALPKPEAGIVPTLKARIVRLRDIQRCLELARQAEEDAATLAGNADRLEEEMDDRQ